MSLMAQQPAPERTLPIFRALPRPLDATPPGLLGTLFKGDAVRRLDLDDRVVFEAGSKRLELDRGTSAFWFADRTQLWTPLDPDDSPPSPLPPGRATTFADLLADLLTKPWERVANAAIRHEPLDETSTMVTTAEGGPVAIDQYGASRLVINVPDPWGPGTIDVPIAGRTAKLAVTLNRSGDPIGAQYSWWDLEYVDDRPVVPATAHLNTLIPESPDLPLDGFTSSLVYHEFEVADGNWLLLPMWMISPTALLEGRRTELMTALRAATDREPPPPRAEPEQTREPGTRMPRADPPPNVYRAGMSWIGTYGGLDRTYESIARVQSVFHRHGWRPGFDWGNELAYEQDWHANNDEWVDAVDFAYFCGHAAFDGWTLARPDDFRLTNGEVGRANSAQPDMYGSGRLRWIVLDACGPLQDPSTGAAIATTAVGRWGGLFDGLRIILAGATKLNVNDFVGERFARLSVDQPLIESWFRANRELRPHTIGDQRVWVGALYATTADEDARHDRLPIPGNGQPAARLFPASVRAMLIAL
jgi:Family of unknown function (DUF6345)